MNRNLISQVREEIAKVIVGKDEIIEAVLMAILAKGHVLLEDIPGVGKTTLALALSKSLSLDYNRMQFTPDVLPADVTGFSMYSKKTDLFEYREGAVMTNLFLADEINRTSPKTQSALLEVMEEGRVTVDGTTHDLPKPFFVIATQNPIGSAGTQKLPESQLDRFMVKLSMGYPDVESEAVILKEENQNRMDEVKSILTTDEIIVMQDEISSLYVADSIFSYIAEILKASRMSSLLHSGVSPRGGKSLLRMARARAYISNRDYVTPEDVIYVFDMVGAHRVTLSPEAKARGLTASEILEEIIKSVELPNGVLEKGM